MFNLHFISPAFLSGQESHSHVASLLTSYATLAKLLDGSSLYLFDLKVGTRILIFPPSPHTPLWIFPQGWSRVTVSVKSKAHSQHRLLRISLISRLKTPDNAKASKVTATAQSAAMELPHPHPLEWRQGHSSHIPLKGFLQYGSPSPLVSLLMRELMIPLRL